MGIHFTHFLCKMTDPFSMTPAASLVESSSRYTGWRPMAPPCDVNVGLFTTPMKTSSLYVPSTIDFSHFFIATEC